MEHVSGYLLLKRRSITLATADILNAKAQRLITENRIARLRRAQETVPDYGREF